MSIMDEQLELDMALGPQLRVFDPQLCTELGLDWLKHSVEGDGVTAADVDSLVNDGIVRRWKSPKGTEGFLIYNERQVRVAKALRESGRYSTPELPHTPAGCANPRGSGESCGVRRGEASEERGQDRQRPTGC